MQPDMRISTSERFAPVASMLDQAVTDGILPGAALHIGQAGHPLFRHVTGQAVVHPMPVPLSEETKYDMASLTKLMATAMVTLRLYERGQLSLSERISRYFSVPRDKKGITLRHLLTHTAGFVPHLMLRDLVPEPGDTIRLLMETPLENAPGHTVSYSCMGFILLGFILEQITSTPLDELAVREVFTPLCMNQTGYIRIDHRVSAKPGDFAATEYDSLRGAWICGTVHDENAAFLNGVAGNAGVFSTVEDCARFLQALSGNGPPSNTAWLSESTLQLARTNHTAGMEESRGLGFSLYDGRTLSCGNHFALNSWGHTGFTGTSCWVDAKSGLSVVLLTNAVHFGRGRDEFFPLRRAIHDKIQEAV